MNNAHMKQGWKNLTCFLLKMHNWKPSSCGVIKNRWKKTRGKQNKMHIKWMDESLHLAGTARIKISPCKIVVRYITATEFELELEVFVLTEREIEILAVSQERVRKKDHIKMNDNVANDENIGFNGYIYFTDISQIHRRYIGIYKLFKI